MQSRPTQKEEPMDSAQPDDKSMAFGEGQRFERKRIRTQVASLRHDPMDYYDGGTSPALKAHNRAIDKILSMIDYEEAHED